jgi:hypothetical protein
MAKLFTIRLSEKGKKIGQENDSSELREIELNALESCISLAGSKEKELKKYHLCNDLKAQIAEFKDNDKIEIKDLSKDDIDIIKKGFAVAVDIPSNPMSPAGGRPGFWMYCISLWEQIENPTEQDAVEEEKAESNSE